MALALGSRRHQSLLVRPSRSGTGIPFRSWRTQRSEKRTEGAHSHRGLSHIWPEPELASQRTVFGAQPIISGSRLGYLVRRFGFPIPDVELTYFRCERSASPWLVRGYSWALVDGAWSGALALRRLGLFPTWCSERFSTRVCCSKRRSRACQPAVAGKLVVGSVCGLSPRWD